MAKILAIANCRVSSNEQLQNNSLARQEKSVYDAAAHLGAEIVQVWSGSISSKAGTNIKRKDLLDMLEVCKKNKSIKYAIFDEYDRFMRSVNEGPYFEVLFQQVGTKVWYASESNTFNGDDAMAKFMRTMSAYKAEGSNEERQRKSINGQTAALRDGRYTFHPKPGYKKGTIPGIHEIHPDRGPALGYILKKLASGIITPTKALIELNESNFTKDHAPYKMDKFRKIATDSFYAGIVRIDKQVKVTNSNGLHKPLITLDEHESIVKIFDGRPKNQTGPSMKGNPAYPMSNLITHDLCIGCKNKGRMVGLNLKNGKTSKVYEKYRCRSCKKYIRKEDLHEDVTDLFDRYEMPVDTQDKILKALGIVWQRDTERVNQEIRGLKLEIIEIEKSILQNAENAADPSNSEIKDELLTVIKKEKETIKKHKIQLENLEASLESDRLEFMKFALSFIEDTGQHFLESYVSKENRVRCKQMLFPAGISIDQENKVYTPEISIFYRLVAKKKDTEASDNSHLVRVRRL